MKDPQRNQERQESAPMEKTDQAEILPPLVGFYKSKKLIIFQVLFRGPLGRFRRLLSAYHQTTPGPVQELG